MFNKLLGKLRWLLSIALCISIVHDERNFPQAKLDSEINAHFL